MRYLLFDADQTIWDFNATEKIGLETVFSSFFIPMSKEMIDAYMAGNLLCWRDYEDGRLTLDELEVKRWRLFFERIGKEDGNAEGAAFLFKEALAHNGILLPGAEEFLTSISERPKSLVTNGIASIQRQRLKDTGCGRHFENIFISSEIGYHKPQKELFAYVLKSLGKNAGECVMIGDSIHSDIEGAAGAGIESIYLNFEGRKAEEATWSVSSYDELRALIETI